MNRLKEYFKIYESEETKTVFEENDYESNRLSFFVILICAVILIVSCFLNMAGIFTVTPLRMNVLTGMGLVEFSIPLVLCHKYKGRKRWLKYVMVFTLLLVCTQLFCILNHNVILIMILPVLLSSRYFSKGLTVIISILSVLFSAAASVATVYFGIIDLNFYPRLADGTSIVVENGLRSSVTALGIDPHRAVISMLVNGYLPRLLVFSVIGFIAVYIAKYGHDMVLKQNEIARASANAKAELNTATQIQNGMVPNIFPAFPERKEFDVYASMNTAKEVGGDFYDFFLVDEKHLAMVMADVSGKGVPAALFMMASKILINDRALMGGTPAEILAFVNDRICSNNQAEMFVTVWLGILEIDTGRVIAANAGHEYPAIRRNGGKYELLKDKHGFVVGGMEGIRYKDYEFTLNKGDSLFLYTDGVPEATDAAQEQFGSDRMIEALNINAEAAPDEILSTVNNEVNHFVGDAVQFDDLTMLCLKYLGID
ncbi:SpoIIE family protein phosphatase [uncultured Ruminococcus sp.]|uniref:PP2C family protein-serine/threonine phosphatase n=1 Tax=uncultured Ruminococcus sp. TaxID=165186 RepID=UPI0029311052|nr:SpoIIE family protein phosphatase [uncultured Ruminococcus sp.]